MALKRTLNQKEYDSLSDDVKALYGKNPKAEGSFLLDLEGSDDAAELKAAKEQEATLRKAEKKRADEAEAKLAALGEADASKRGDVEALAKSWQEKLDKTSKEAQEKLDKKDAFLRQQLIDGKAMELATQLSKTPMLLLPHIKARLAADLDGDVPATKVLGVDGKPSALTIDDLKKEFLANKEFSSILLASKASGSGTNPNDAKPQGHGGAPLDAKGQPLAFRDMTVPQKVAHIDAKKQLEQEGND